MTFIPLKHILHILLGSFFSNFFLKKVGFIKNSSTCKLVLFDTILNWLVEKYIHDKCVAEETRYFQRNKIQKMKRKSQKSLSMVTCTVACRERVEQEANMVVLETEPVCQRVLHYV